MPLTLTVPAPDQAEKLNVETRPRHLKAWLDNLPLANLPEASRVLCDGIGALNRRKVGMETRLKLLELYRDAALKLLPALEEQYVAARLPLPEKNRRMADLARKLQMELANGYKIILLDYQGRRLALGMGKVAQAAAQRAMSALGRVLAVCYQTYAPTPSGIWFEVHQIFRFAIEQGIANEPVADMDGESSVGLVYKQTLLLALSNPYLLNPGEVERIQNYLALFGGLAQLQPFAQTGNTVGLFLVQTDGDNPPRPVSRSTDGDDSRNGILLNTLELAHALHHHVERLDAGESPKNLRLPVFARESGYRDMLRHLLRHWSAAPKRVFQRIQNICGTEVCIGLPAIHHFLGGAEADSEGNDLEFTSAPAAKGPKLSSGKWLIVNESAGGLALRGILEILPQVRPGDIIGLKMEGTGAWHIGAVRWVKSDKAKHLEIGAQLVAPKADPVRVRPSIAGPADASQPALLLPEILLLKQPETLVAPRGTFGPQRELLIEFGGGMSQTVRAARLVEQTASFERFEFGSGQGTAPEE